MNREGLVGQPTSEVVRYIALNNPQIQQFSLTGYAYDASGYLNIANPKTIDRGRVLFPDWFHEAQRAVGMPYLGIASMVITEGGVSHIPMLDFDHPGGRRSVKRLRQILARLNLPPGAIISSGRGYHYMGFELLPETGFDDVARKVESLPDNQNGRPTGTYTGIDYAWMYASETRDFWVLRVNQGFEKPKLPKVITLYNSHLMDKMASNTLQPQLF